MPLYKYSAVNAAGETENGTFSAADNTSIYKLLKDKNLYPVKVKQVVSSKDIKDLNISTRVGTRDIALFCRQFHTMLNAGITIVKVLDILQLQTENKKLKKVALEIHEKLQKGSSLSESMKPYKAVFPELMINMIETGEASGSLDKVMANLAVHFEKETKIKNKIKGAMVYPIVLSVVAIAVVIFLLVFVMPTFLSMFESSGVTLPGPTRALLGISNALKNYWYLIFGAIITIVLGTKSYVGTEKGRENFDTLKFKIPVVKGTLTKIYTARFTGTLATLLSSGVPLLYSFEIVSRVIGNSLLEKKILGARDDIRRGMSIAGPIQRIGLFPPLVHSMVKIGEEAGSLDAILEKTASYYDDEVEVALQKMVTMLEPLLIVVMGGMIGFIVVAMLMPMFDMVNTVQ